MKRPSLKKLAGEYPMISTAIGVVTLIGAIGGGLMALGDAPPYASRERVAQVDRRQDLSELNQVDAQIVALERIPMRTPAEESLLRRLYLQRKVLCAKLNVPGC